MRGGRHGIPLEIVHDEPLLDVENLKQEWLRDVGMSYDPTTRAYKKMNPKRTATTWRALQNEESLLVVRYPDLKLLGGDYWADEISDADEPTVQEESSDYTYRSYRASGSTIEMTSMEEHLKGNLQDHFDPRFVIVKVVGGSSNEDGYKELCGGGSEYLDSSDGVQKMQAFLETQSLDSRLDRSRHRSDIELDTGNLALCDLLNGMAGHIIGPTYQDLFGRDTSGEFFMSR